MSIGALVLSPLTKGLFKRAILQSGSPNSFLGSEPKESAFSTAKSLAKSLHCNTSSVPDMIECIREKPAEDILSFSKHSIVDGQTFTPIFGEEVMPIKPSLALKEGNFNNNIDILFGTVKDEGSIFTKGILEMVPSLSNITVSKAKTAITLLFMLMKQPYASEVAQFYTKGLKDSDEDQLHKAISQSFGDYHLTCPTILFGSAIAFKNKNNKSYSYRMSLKPSLPILNCEGVCHGDDIVQLFGFPIKLRAIGFTENDYKLSTDMIKAWTTFAKTGYF
jgi:carboxylesterase type B